MSWQSDINQINRGLEQYARTFTTESEEYSDLEFQLTRLLGYPQIDKGGTGRRFSKSQQFSYDAKALAEAKKLVQGKNTAAAQAQGYYQALQEADTEITQSAVRKMAKNLLWIRENKDEIYNLLKNEYGEEWADSDTRAAYVNSYDNDVASLFSIFTKDMEYRNSKGDDTLQFLDNIDRIRKALAISEAQRKQYAREKRYNTRTQRLTAKELRQLRKWTAEFDV